MNPTRGACKGCGHTPACGFASVNDDWYCHGDCPHEDESSVSCYELAGVTAMQSSVLSVEEETE